MQSGASVLVSRDVLNFHRIVLIGRGVLRIAQDVRESLAIKADLGLLREIETEVIDGRLAIRPGKTFWDKVGFAFVTGLTRPPIVHRLTVKELAGWDV